jgi:hypothetical protein
MGELYLMLSHNKRLWEFKLKLANYSGTYVPSDKNVRTYL